MPPDANVRELRRHRFRLARQVVASPQQHAGEAGYHLAIPSKGEYLAIGPQEAVFLSLLNGERSFAEVISLAARVLGPQAPNESEALHFCTQLLKAGVLEMDDAGGALRSTASPPSRWRLWNPFWMQVPLLNPDRLLGGLLPAFRWMFHPLFVLLSLGLLLVALATLWTSWSRFAASSGVIFTRDNWLWLGAAWFGLKVVHELSHGLACKHHGGEVRDLGLVMILFAPMAYVDVTSSWGLRSRWQRMHIAAAGMWTELVLASIAVLVWNQTSSPELAHRLYNVIVMAGVTTLLFNLNPLMRFDGYYLLSDALDLPNLAQRGAQSVRRTMQRWGCGIAPVGPIERGASRWLIGLYGWAAAVWKVIVMVGLLLTASVMFQGAGIVMAVAAGVLWLGQPLWNVAQWARRTRASSPLAVARGLVTLAAVAALVVAPLIWLPNPRGAVAPGVIDFAEANHVRAGGDGFVTAILVRDGEHVDAETPLLRLRNEALENELRDVEISLRECEIRRLAAVNSNELGTAQIEAARLAALEQRRQEKQRQVDGLTVRAPRSGYVIARRLAERLDTYVEEGEELCILGDDSAKEVVLALDQPMLRRVSAGDTLDVRTAAGQEFTGRLSRLTPRARLTAPHPGLCAINGGPLANAASEGDDRHTETPPLLDPVVDARLALDADAARRLSAGQLCYAVSHAQPESLGHSLYRSARDWVADRIDSLEAETRRR